MPIAFDNTYSRLPERFFARQQPAQVPAPRLVRVNDQLAVALGLDPTWLRSDDGVAMLAGNTIPDGAEPIAQAYAGHQFGGFVPQLGDGRAILLGEVVGRDGVRRDVQLKGSGRTRFSRGGDGKAVLGPALREFIVSEAMAALGVATQRGLAVVTTGESVARADGVRPGAVFTRVAASHIRVGTFEYFRARNDVEALRLLADHAIARHHPEAARAPHPYVALLEAVIRVQADLIAHWMSIGFIHGVMNTDNTAVSGESIDFGPCAFMDAFHPRCVYSSIDSQGRYAWGSQPDVGVWNLTRFAETLLPLLHDEQRDAIALAEAALSTYGGHFRDRYVARFRAKLGLSRDAPMERTIQRIQTCLDLLASQQVDFTCFFRELSRATARLAVRRPDAPAHQPGGRAPAGAEDDTLQALAALFADPAPFQEWFAEWRVDVRSDADVAEMCAANPVRIPRNHRVEQAIQSAYGGDFGPFHRLVDALADPYVEHPEYADLEAPPRPDEIVHQTFCGT